MNSKNNRRFIRIPSKGYDSLFGLSRSWFYAAEREGILRLRRIALPGKTRGVVLVSIAEVEALIERQNPSEVVEA